MFAALLLFALALIFTAWLAYLRMFGMLIRLEYSSYRERWEQDGRPTVPFFFRPPETTMLGGLVTRPGSRLARQRCYIAWLFWTPEWMRQDRRALRWVFWMRILTLICYACIVGTAVTMPYIAPLRP